MRKREHIERALARTIESRRATRRRTAVCSVLLLASFVPAYIDWGPLKTAAAAAVVAVCTVPVVVAVHFLTTRRRIRELEAQLAAVADEGGQPRDQLADTARLL